MGHTSPIKITYSSPEDTWLKSQLIQLLEYSTGRSTLEKKLTKIVNADPSINEIWGMMIDELDIKLEVNWDKFDQLPTNGPLILIANHPFGVVDGIIMAHLASQIRPHFKALVNEVLCREDYINSCFLPVDFRNTKQAIEINLNSRKLALKYLKEGGTIVIFPAGGVSTATAPFKKAEDFEWKRFVLKMIEKTNATVLPIHFKGQNSQLFQVASWVHLNLRYGLLLNEVKNKIGKEINVTIGEPVDAKVWGQFKRDEVLKFLRDKVYELGK